MLEMVNSFAEMREIMMNKFPHQLKAEIGDSEAALVNMLTQMRMSQDQIIENMVLIVGACSRIACVGEGKPQKITEIKKALDNTTFPLKQLIELNPDLFFDEPDSDAMDMLKHVASLADGYGIMTVGVIAFALAYYGSEPSEEALAYLYELYKG